VKGLRTMDVAGTVTGLPPPGANGRLWDPRVRWGRARWTV